MTQVNLSDGRVLNFPDGMSADQMHAAIQANFGSAAPSAGPGSADDTAVPNVGGSVQNVLAGTSAAMGGLANGLTLGLAPRIQAGAEALTGLGGTRGDYAGNLKADQQAVVDEAAAHPVASMAGNIAGTIAGPGKAFALARGLSVVPRILAGGGIGAALGGAQGAMDSPDLTDVAQTTHDAGRGAALGGVMGAGGEALGAGAGKALETVANWVGRQPGEMLPAAGKMLTGAINKDGGIQAARDMADQLGPQAMLLDTGPSVRGMGQALAGGLSQRTAIVNPLIERSQGVPLPGGTAADFVPGTGTIGRLGTAVNDTLQVDKEALGANPYGALERVGGGYAAAAPAAVPPLAQRISDAYQKVTGDQMGARGMLSDIRAQLPDVPPAELDRQLVQMARDGTIHMQGLENGKEITPAFRAGALNYGGEPAHFMMMDEPIASGVPKRYADSGTPAPVAQVERAAGAAEIPDSPIAASGVLRQARTDVTEPMYVRALANAPKIDTSDPLIFIGQALNTAQGPQKAALAKAREMLMSGPVDPVTGRPTPLTNAAALNQVKITLSSLIDHGDPGLGIAPGAVGQQQGALKRVVGKLDSALKDQVPGYAEATAASADYAGRVDAIDRGTHLLTGGDSAARPDDLSATLEKLNPSQRAGVALGARGQVDARLGTNANDLSELSKALEGWQRQKLGQVFGQQNADKLAGTVANERLMQNTHNRIVAGSDTGARAGAKADYAAATAEPAPLIPKEANFFGTLVNYLEKAGRSAIGLSPPTEGALAAAHAPALTAQGPDLAKLLASLETVAKRGVSNAKMGAAAGAPIGALAGSTGYNEGRRYSPF